MTESESDFALVPTTEDTLTKRRRPVLVQNGKKVTTSDLQFHPTLAADYITDRGRKRWVPTGELARVFFMRDSKDNRMKIRRRLSRIWQAVLSRNDLLIYDIHPREGTQAVKIFNPQSEEERQALDARLGRMEKLGMLKADQVVKARQLKAVAEALAATA